jgi:hypothetical protein
MTADLYGRLDAAYLLVATPVDATIALQPRSWGIEIDLT